MSPVRCCALMSVWSKKVIKEFRGTMRWELSCSASGFSLAIASYSSYVAFLRCSFIFTNFQNRDILWALTNHRLSYSTPFVLYFNNITNAMYRKMYINNNELQKLKNCCFSFVKLRSTYCGRIRACFRELQRLSTGSGWVGSWKQLFMKRIWTWKPIAFPKAEKGMEQMREDLTHLLNPTVSWIQLQEEKQPWKNAYQSTAA